MNWTDRALLFSSVYRALTASAPIGLIDCGARDNIPEPWASLDRHDPDAVRVIGFEADAEEAKKLNQQHGSRRRYTPAAAWRDVGERPFYLTSPPQTSSMFPPNEALAHLFAPAAGGFVNLLEGRVLQRVVTVPTTTVDAVLAEASFDADFLKIDTQGAEYEILEGANEALSSSLFAVVAETWTVPVYKDVKPTWDVMKLMADSGYTFMTQELAGLSRRSFADANTLGFAQHAQIIGLELLFFREAKSFVANAASPAKAYKAVGIADVFGFADYGAELLREVVMKWPGELENVQNCFRSIAQQRSIVGTPLSALYPRLHG